MDYEFLTVDKKTFQKIIQKYAEDFENMAQFQRTLHDDYKLAKQNCIDASQNRAGSHG